MIAHDIKWETRKIRASWLFSLGQLISMRKLVSGVCWNPHFCCWKILPIEMGRSGFINELDTCFGSLPGSL